MDPQCIQRCFVTHSASPQYTSQLLRLADSWLAGQDWLAGRTTTPEWHGTSVPLMSPFLEPGNMALWLALGYIESDVLAFLNATQIVSQHPNALLDLRMPNQVAIKTALDDAARLVEVGGVASIPGVDGLGRHALCKPLLHDMPLLYSTHIWVACRWSPVMHRYHTPHCKCPNQCHGEDVRWREKVQAGLLGRHWAVTATR